MRIRTASTLCEALQQARDAERLDLVLLDLGLPDCSGIDALLRFRREFPALRVLVVSADEDRVRMTAALQAGASGYLPKSFIPSFEHHTSAPAAPVAPAGGGNRNALGLTEQQLDMLRLVAQGLDNKDIARELDIAEASVEQQMHDIFRALGVSSRVEAMVAAAQLCVRLY